MLLRLLFLVVFLLPGLAHADKPLKIVATTADLAAVARAVGGDHVKVTVLAQPTQDPHWVDARPNLALALSRADILLAVGLDLEVGWLPPLQSGSRNPKIQPGGSGFVDCSRFVHIREVPTVVDRAQGDVHPGGNPHYMMAPAEALSVANGLAIAFSQHHADHAREFAVNAAEFARAIGEGLARWEQQLAPLKDREVVTYHRSWIYLGAWADLTMHWHVEPRPGIPPSPNHLAALLGHARQHDVALLLQEAWHPSKSSQLVADKAGVPLVVVPGAPSMDQDYVAWMDEVVTALASAAKGTEG